MHTAHYETIHAPLEMVDIDICGPIRERFLEGAWYFITFIDDATWRVWPYSLKMKDEALEMFIQWCIQVEHKSRHKVKALRSENGGEYTSRAFTKDLSQKGICHQWTTSNTSMQNGLVE